MLILTGSELSLGLADTSVDWTNKRGKVVKAELVMVKTNALRKAELLDTPNEYPIKSFRQSNQFIRAL